MKNWKKASAAILVAGLITTSAGQVWADETDKVDSTIAESNLLVVALENVKDGTATSHDLEEISSIVPTGYTANNIFALSKNIEKVSNPKAKAALQKNIDKALAKWEEKNTEETETPEEVTEVPVDETKDSVVGTTEVDTEDLVGETLDTDSETADVEEAPEVESDAEVKLDLEKQAAALEKAEEKKAAALAKAEEKKAAALAKAEEKKAAVLAKVEEKKAAAQAKVEEKKAAVLAKAEEKKAAVQAKVEEKKAKAAEKSAKGDKE